MPGGGNFFSCFPPGGGDFALKSCPGAGILTEKLEARESARGDGIRSN